MSDGTTGSALAEVIDASVGQGSRAAPSPELEQQDAFSRRSKALRDRVQDLCNRGLSRDAEYHAVFKGVQDHWDAGRFAGGDVDAAFQAVEAKIDEVEDRAAAQLEAAQRAAEERTEFSGKLTQARSRVTALVSAGAAKWADFDAPFDTLKGHSDRGELKGDAADKAFAELERLVAAAERKAGLAKLYEPALRQAEQKVAELGKNTYLPQGGADTARDALDAAKALAKAGDYEGALKGLQKAEREADKAERLAAEEKEISDNREKYIADVFTRNLQELNITKEEMDEILTEEQLSELVRWEKGIQAIKNDRRRKDQRRELRARYMEIRKEVAEAAAEEVEEAPEPEETEEERRDRIHRLKLRFKSITSLLTLDEEGEIYSTREVFSNRGADHAVGVGSVADYVSGYDIFLRDGPDEEGKITRYRKMIVHFHFSDKAMTRIERAHFKTNHAAADKSHVLITTAQQPAALAVCKAYL